MSYSFTAASSQRLHVASAPATVAPLTISAWVKPTAVASTVSIAALTDTANGNTRFALLGSTTSVGANAHDGAAAGSSNVSALAAGSWQHVAAVFASTTSRTGYHAAVAATPNTTSVSPASIDTFTIGARTNSSVTAFFDGLIAEVAIWTSALSGANITSLAGGSSPMNIGTNPVAYWRLNTDGGLTDSVGGVTLTNANAATYSADHPTVAAPPTASSPSDFTLLGVG